MKRIVLVIPTFPKLSETFIVSKFMALISRGLDVQIVCSESSKKEWTYFPDLQSNEDNRHRVHRSWPHSPVWLAVLLWPAMFIVTFLQQPLLLSRYLLKGWKMFGSDIFRRLYLDHAVIALDPDLVHFEFGALAVGRTYLKELLECRLTVSFRGHDLTFVGLDQPDYYRSVWKEVDGIHCLSAYLSDRAVARGCPVEKPRTIIPPAVSPKNTLPAKNKPTNGHRLRVISVGRLTWVKDYETALLAVDRVRTEGVPLDYWIIGDGEELESVAFQIHQQGLGEVVTLYGALSPNTVQAMLVESDIFLHSAISEGFCNAVLEAQAAGIPVVCSDAGGLPENVVDGVTGFVVSRCDPEAMADKIKLLAADPVLRQKMGLAGRRRAVEHFNLSGQIESFHRFYQQIMNGSKHAH